MKNNKDLRDKIVQSIFLYETKRMTLSMFIRICILLISLSIILIFGGVIYDIYIEGELGSLINTYSLVKIEELASVIINEMPGWLFLMYFFGLALGCIIIGIAIKNRKRIFHKIISIFSYWIHL